MARLQDKVAIVTGAARGIGASFAQALAKEGARVVVADVLEGGMVADRIGREDGAAIYCHTDVSVPADVSTLVDATLRRFGTIDILVNNAAVFANLNKKSFLEISGEEWDKVMAVNVRGPFECAKAVAPG